MLIITFMVFVAVYACACILEAISKGWLINKGIETVRRVVMICKLTIVLSFAVLLISMLVTEIL